MTGRILHAGPFYMLYHGGHLRRVSYGNQEVLRMIYFALRDENWGTFKPIIENELVDGKRDHFTIRYDCFHEKDGERIFHWRVSIDGSADGTIRFGILGKALKDVLKNRAGFCVLHPVAAKRQPCRTIHSDGSIVNNHFPDYVAPENPFKSLTGFQWEVGQHWYALKFEGDIFETEDQRNWTDASFKTFCTPLDKPFPVWIKKNETVDQQVTFTPESNLKHIPAPGKIIELTVTKEKVKLPRIGIGASTEADEIHFPASQLLRDLKFEHYKIDAEPSKLNWVSAFLIDCGNARKLQLPLKVTLTLAADFIQEIEQFTSLIKQLNAEVKQILLLSSEELTTPQALIDCIPLLKKQLPDCLIGAGTDYNFTELNRNRFQPDTADFVSFSIHPQEHAFDDYSIIENIEAQREVVRSAYHIYPEQAVHVSPLLLKKRYNPYASESNQRVLSNADKADPRQTEPFGAVFTLGSIKRHALAGTSSITLYQTIGKQGLVSDKGERFPVYDALNEILDDVYALTITTSSQPLKVDALLVEGIRASKLIVINFTNSIQKVRMIGRPIKDLLPYEIKTILL